MMGNGGTKSAVLRFCAGTGPINGSVTCKEIPMNNIFYLVGLVVVVLAVLSFVGLR